MAIRNPALGARPQAADATAKPITPRPNSRFLPKRSLSEPLRSKNDARVRK
jgi:hypothetical protein